MRLSKLFAVLQLWSGARGPSGRVKWTERDVGGEVESYSVYSNEPLKINWLVDSSNTELRVRIEGGSESATEDGEWQVGTVPAAALEDGAWSTVRSERRSHRMDTFVSGDLCSKGALSASDLTATFSWAKERRKFKDPERTPKPPQKVFVLKIRCVHDTSASVEAGDVWAFDPTPDFDNGWSAVNSLALVDQVTQPSDWDEELEDNDDPLTHPAINPVYYVWSVPGSGLIDPPGAPQPGAHAYLPVGGTIFDAVFSSAAQASFSQKMGPTTRWAADHGQKPEDWAFKANVLDMTDSAQAEAWQRPPPVWLVRSDKLRSRLGQVYSLRGFDLELPTQHRECAAALDAECLCERQAESLASRGGPKHFDLERDRVASVTACCMGEDDWVAAFPHAGGTRVHRAARAWCAGSNGVIDDERPSGACSVPGSRQPEQATRATLCKDRVTPVKVAEDYIVHNYFHAHSSFCPYMGTTLSGAVYEIRLWSMAKTHVCHLYDRDMQGRLDRLSLSKCRALAKEKTDQGLIRYIRTAKCVCSVCGGARDAAEEMAVHFLQSDADRRALALFERQILGLGATLRLDTLETDDTSDGLVVRAASHDEDLCTVVIPLDGILGHRQPGERFEPRPGAAALLASLGELCAVVVWECDGVPERQLDALDAATDSLGVLAGGLCDDLSPRRSLTDYTQPLLVKNAAATGVDLPAGRRLLIDIDRGACWEHDPAVMECAIVSAWRAGIEPDASPLVTLVRDWKSAPNNKLSVTFTAAVADVVAAADPAIVVPYGAVADSALHDGQYEPWWAALSLGVALAQGDAYLEIAPGRDGEAEGLTATEAVDRLSAQLKKPLADPNPDVLEDLLGSDGGAVTFETVREMASEAYPDLGVRASSDPTCPASKLGSHLSALLEYPTMPVSAVLRPLCGDATSDGSEECDAGDALSIHVSSAGFGWGFRIQGPAVTHVADLGNVRAEFPLLEQWARANVAGGAAELLVFIDGLEHAHGPAAVMAIAFRGDTLTAPVSETATAVAATAVFDRVEAAKCPSTSAAAAVQQAPPAECARVRDLRVALMTTFVQHNIDALAQEWALQRDIAAVSATFVVIHADFKQNVECVKDARLKQKDYFCIPVMAYHSFIIYTVDGIKTFDTWSMNKDKNTCWMSNALEQLFQEERKDGGMLDGVTKISFWSDNGPPYHSGEWMLQLLNLGLTDYSESYSAAGIEWIINFSVAGEGKSRVDGHFGVITQYIETWVKLYKKSLRPESVPELIEFFRKQMPDSKFSNLPTNHASEACPSGGNVKKVAGVTGLHQFARVPDEDKIRGRRYSYIGEWKTLKIKEEKRKAKQAKRSGQVDTLRKAGIRAVQRFDREVGRSGRWKTHETCAATGFGLTVGGRFIAKSKADSPLSAAPCMCFADATKDVCEWVVSDAYTSGTPATPWLKPQKGRSTCHTCFRMLAEAEAISIGLQATPAIPRAKDNAISADLIAVVDAALAPRAIAPGPSEATCPAPAPATTSGASGGQSTGQCDAGCPRPSADSDAACETDQVEDFDAAAEGADDEI